MGAKGDIQNIPLEQARELIAPIIEYLQAKKNQHEIEEFVLAGSLRREKATVNDVDIIVQVSSEDKQADILAEFAHDVGLKRIISAGSVKASFVLQNGLQVDVYTILPGQMGAMLLYFTGSAGFNIALRARANRMGYKLNEKYLTDRDGTPYYSDSEEDILSKLGLAYIPPTERSINEGDFSTPNRLFRKYEK